MRSSLSSVGSMGLAKRPGTTLSQPCEASCAAASRHPERMVQRKDFGQQLDNVTRVCDFMATPRAAVGRL
jgi:hypothetical protein